MQAGLPRKDLKDLFSAMAVKVAMATMAAMAAVAVPKVLQQMSNRMCRPYNSMEYYTIIVI